MNLREYRSARKPFAPGNVNWRVLFFVAAICWPARSTAQTPVTASDVVAICRDALALAKAGNFRGARDLYTKAYAAQPSSPILFNLALAEIQLPDHALDALMHLRQYLKAPDAELAKAAVINANLLPRAYAATGHIRIVWLPAPSHQYLDGKAVALEAKSVVDVQPGAHSITATNESAGWRADVIAEAGKVVPADLDIVFVHHSQADGGAPGPRPSSSATAKVAAPGYDEFKKTLSR